MSGAQKTLLVFDLDFTLWNAGGTWCDHTRPPYRKQNNKVTDADGSHIRLYPDVLPVLDELQQREIPLAIASKTTAPDWARALLDLFNIRSCFHYEEIYPGNKTRHFHQLSRKSQIEFEDMIFFDDEYPNILDVGALGVNAVHVKNGISRKMVLAALGLFNG